jgi:hypothetical protein
MTSSEIVAPILVGLAAGYLSGQFGIGGGIITTPAIRLLLGYPALIAVGTPLLVVLPTALAGATAYARRGLSDTRAGIVIGAAGAAASVVGALATRLVGGAAVLVITAALILWMAIDMVLLALRGEPRGPEEAPRAGRQPLARQRAAGLVLLGVVTGLYSGVLGLGGGFVVVPSLVRWFGFDIKRAIGTSLVVVSVLAVPGSLTHLALGNIDLRLAGLLMLGVIPGALVGARVTAVVRGRTIKLAFAALLAVVGIVLGIGELGVL